MIHSLRRTSKHLFAYPQKSTVFLSVERNRSRTIIMKFFMLTILAATALSVQAAAFSSITALSLTLFSMNKPVSGFFGFFRRRSPKPSVIEETLPTGPVNFLSNFPQAERFANPFSGMNRFGFLPNFGYPNFPAGMFQNGFMQQQQQPPRQSWPPQFKPASPPTFNPASPPTFNPQMPQFNPEETKQMNEASESEFGFDREVRFEDQPTINTEEAESFFTLLAETDENKCISRLVCEMGADPSTAGELGTTVSEIIGSLTDFPDGSKVLEYNQILQKGRTEGLGTCRSSFSSCDEESYSLMKNSQAEDSSEES
ncbi:uncharacterized protein CDAR_592702 [Caerostris darwini]|uniref:Uncharacterized protein n=1 Tax=Caerostris darwini TaxID=1538125 RepID=A0AAV4S0D6_9ARAC|nr:uncharacterized protein CDAR_592702 [Caerostris darwini]